MLAGLALVFAALQPVYGRPLRGLLLGPGRAVAELRTPWPCLVYDDAPIGVKSRWLKDG